MQRRSRKESRASGIKVSVGGALDMNKVWVRTLAMIGPVETKERLNSEWTTQGVVGALLLSITFGYVMSGFGIDPSDELSENSVTDLKKAGAMFMSISSACSMVSIVLSVYFSVQMNLLPEDADVEWFIDSLSPFFGMPNLFMTIAFFAMVLSGYCAQILLHGVGFGLITSSTMFLLFLGGYLFTRWTGCKVHHHIKNKHHSVMRNSKKALEMADIAGQPTSTNAPESL